MVCAQDRSSGGLLANVAEDAHAPCRLSHQAPPTQKKRQRDQPGYASATFPTTHRRPHTSQALPRRAHNIADCGVTWSGDEQLKLGGGRDSVSCLPSLWPVSNQHDATPTIARNADLSAGTANPQERVTARHIHGGLTRTAHTTKPQDPTVTTRRLFRSPCHTSGAFKAAHAHAHTLMFSTPGPLCCFPCPCTGDGPKLVSQSTFCEHYRVAC